uniref:MMS19 nucleotide excision repair protein n=1 Tax=Zea mays TaxID=4577 RepID=A0A804LR17_MAIZE
MVDSLAKLSMDVGGKDLVYSLLLVFSGMLMDEKDKECILDNIQIRISVLSELVSYPHMMVVQETTLQCLVAFSTFPHPKIYTVRRKVVQAAILSTIRNGMFVKWLSDAGTHGSPSLLFVIVHQAFLLLSCTELSVFGSY